MSEAVENASAAKSQPFEHVSLFLQGGGALGSYQAGAYRLLNEVGVCPDNVYGLSVGAYNAGIIAGNPPDKTVAKLEKYWNSITTDNPWDNLVDRLQGVTDKATNLAFGQSVRPSPLAFVQSKVFLGVKGMCSEIHNPFLSRPGTPGATSYSSTDVQLKSLPEVIDFDYLRSSQSPTRLNVGAVDVESGELVTFSSKPSPAGERSDAKYVPDFGPKHIMASGALPPLFPAVEVEGKQYLDGGLVSHNDPFREAQRNNEVQDNMLLIQVDLWHRDGALPQNIDGMELRKKHIAFASREPIVSENIARNTVKITCPILPNDDSTADFDFSKEKMKTRMEAGYHDMLIGLCKVEILARLDDKVVENVKLALVKQPDWLQEVGQDVLCFLGLDRAWSAGVERSKTARSAVR